MLPQRYALLVGTCRGECVCVWGGGGEGGISLFVQGRGGGMVHLCRGAEAWQAGKLKKKRIWFVALVRLHKVHQLCCCTAPHSSCAWGCYAFASCTQSCGFLALACS